MKVKDKVNYVIARQGYIKIDEFIKIALSECSDSYYRNKSPIGEMGDFITGPEISQMFGEIIGMWATEKWFQMGVPYKMNLIELGPGKGSLIKNLLNITKNNEDFHNALNIHLIDINDNLINLQKEKLNNFNIEAKWSTNLPDIADYPTIVIGNEFLDSLPIKQYIMVQDIWKERVIIINSKREFEYSSIEIPNLEVFQELKQYESARNGSTIEISQESKNYLTSLKNIVGSTNAHFLFIDYGYNIDPKLRKTSHYNSTLQSMKNHKYYDIFDDIGDCDLTSHVDFHMISNFASDIGFKVKPIISQKEFLINYGIDHRLRFLMRDKNQELQTILYNQYKRLVGDQEMGNLFKVLEFSSIPQ